MSGLGIPAGALPPGFGVAGSGSSPRTHVVHPAKKKGKAAKNVRHPKPQVVRPMPAAAMGAAGIGAAAGLGAMRPPLAAGMMNPGIVNPGVVPGAIPGMPGIPGMPALPGMGVPGMGMGTGANPLGSMRSPQLNATNQSGLNPGGSPLNQSVTNANTHRAHGTPMLPFSPYGGLPPYMPGAYGGCPVHDSYGGSAWSGYGYGAYPYQEGGIKGFFKRMLGMY